MEAYIFKTFLQLRLFKFSQPDFQGDIHPIFGIHLPWLYCFALSGLSVQNHEMGGIFQLMDKCMYQSTAWTLSAGISECGKSSGEESFSSLVGYSGRKAIQTIKQ